MEKKVSEMEVSERSPLIGSKPKKNTLKSCKEAK
jgi:hypothetical protein